MKNIWLRRVLVAASVFTLVLAFQNCSRFASNKTAEMLQPSGSPDPSPNPPGPMNLAATANTPNTVRLTWEAPTEPVLRYEIMRVSPSNSAKLDLANTFTEVTYTGLDAGVEYQFRLKAVHATGSTESEFVAATTSTTATTVTKPSQATGLSISGVTDTQVTLTWDDNSNNETRFRLFRKKSGDSIHLLIAETAPNETSFVDSGLDPDTKYIYTLLSSNAAGQLPEESSEVVKTLSAGSVLTPLGLSLVPASTTEIEVTWNYNSNEGLGVEIRRAANPIGSFTTVHSAATNSGTFVDSGLDPSTKYYYMLRFKDGSGNVVNNPGEAKSEAAWTMFPVGAPAKTLPAAPTGVTATANSSTSVQVSWSGSCAEPSCTFSVQRSDRQLGPFSGVMSGLYATS